MYCGSHPCFLCADLPSRALLEKMQDQCVEMELSVIGGWGVMGGGTEHGAYETHGLMRNPTLEDVCRAHPIASMRCSHFTFPFWSWGAFPFPFPPPPRPPIQRKFGVVLLGTPQMHLLALLARAAQQPTMVKSCHIIDPGISYVIDAKGVIKSTVLPKKLEWERGGIKYWADKAAVAGQSPACNDLQPGARFVGEAYAKFSKGKTVTIPCTLPKRSACGRLCWELKSCELCKALRKRKN